MKKIRLVSICLAILAMLLIAVPALADSPTATGTYNVNGIETNAGSWDGTHTNGATFVATATQWSPFSSGLLYASVDYVGNGPNPEVGNIIDGGKWSLTVTLGKVKGIIQGNIAEWDTHTHSSKQNYLEWT